MSELNLEVTEAGAIITKAMICVLRERLAEYRATQNVA
jgi:hypothetical protein